MKSPLAPNHSHGLSCLCFALSSSCPGLGGRTLFVGFWSIFFALLSSRVSWLGMPDNDTYIFSSKPGPRSSNWLDRLKAPFESPFHVCSYIEGPPPFQEGPRANESLHGSSTSTGKPSAGPCQQTSQPDRARHCTKNSRRPLLKSSWIRIKPYHMPYETNHVERTVCPRCSHDSNLWIPRPISDMPPTCLRSRLQQSNNPAKKPSSKATIQQRNQSSQSNQLRDSSGGR